MSSRYVKRALDKAIECIDPTTKFDTEQLAIEIRQIITEEHDATNSYLSLVPHIEDKEIAKIITDIANEEKVHVGELQEILYKLSPVDKQKEEEGRNEN